MPVIEIQERQPFLEMVKNLMPIIMNYFMAREYLGEGLTEGEFKELASQNPNIEQYFEKKGKRFVYKGPDIKQIENQELKDVLLEYYRRESLKEKMKRDPFTYMGGVQQIISNPSVMGYLSDITGAVKAKRKQRAQEDVNKILSEQVSKILPGEWDWIFGKIPGEAKQTLGYGGLIEILQPLFLMMLYSKLFPKKE